MEHLNDADISAYCDGSLSPDQLRATDKHLQACAECRRKALRLAGAAISAGLFGPANSPHLSYDELVAYAEERMEAGARAQATVHLDLCPQCRAEADDLLRIRVPRVSPRRPRAAWWIIVAAGVILLGFLFWRLQNRRSQMPPPISEFSGLVGDALRNGRVDVPEPVLALRGKSASLPGTPESRFGLLRPVATAVASAQPKFEWSPVGNDAQYVVAVFDSQLNPIVRSATLAEPAWTPPQPLAAGEYLWQVTATVGSKSVLAPGDSDPPAKFLVLDEAQRQSLERAAKERPGDHLLLGVLYARAGVLDDAERELRLADPVTARPLLESLRK